MRDRNKFMHSKPLKLHFIEELPLTNNYHKWLGHELDGSYEISQEQLLRA